MDARTTQSAGPLWLPLTAIYAALTLVALDVAIVNVALPTIALTLRVSAAASVAVATSYQLAVVISLLPFAALGESYGPRKVFVGGASLFVLASAACALSTSLASSTGSTIVSMYIHVSDQHNQREHRKGRR